MTKHQARLLKQVKPLLPANTHQLAVALGHQAHENTLCGRLYRLAEIGALSYTERRTGRAVIERIWTKGE